MAGIVDLRELLAGMDPALDNEAYVFAAFPAGEAGFAMAAACGPWALAREGEGWTAVVPAGVATPGAERSPPLRRIELRVHSSLAAVGLTAAVAGELAKRGISANVVAAYYHDHVFVPADRAGEARDCLAALSAAGRAGKGAAGSGRPVAAPPAAVDIRDGRYGDIDGFLALQSKNLADRLSDEEKKQGFVTTPFTPAQVAELVERGGLFVADRGGEVAGYAVAAGWDYFRGRPMFELMAERFARLSFHGLAIDPENSFQYGPVCVAAELRGGGTFGRLFDHLRRRMAGRYAVGATFINQSNTRSFEAHTRKLGLEVIDEFEFGPSRYWGLAFPTQGA